ncbi:MAG: molybdopterin-dependent oxidoreductase [Deltaproteobacteria bacterium]|nr:molybdopterin-dependent oxidoreductase [Deltaproteobacteria bacterium]
MVKLTIDGKEIMAEADRTILEVAQENGIYIPTLCYHPRLTPIGSCRLCVVEIEGADRPMTACTTYVQDGIVVHTQTERLNRIRQDALKLILLNHPLDCPQCDAAGACELQNLVFEFGIDQQDYQATKASKGMREFATPLIRQWVDRCVMCMRCIRACHEIVRVRAIDLAGKGYDAEIEMRDPEACISCGECLRVCPVGALTERVSRIKARPWQQQKVLTTCNYCSLGCQLELNIFENKVIRATTKEDKGANKGSLCQRGSFGYDFLNHPQRVTRPMIKGAGKWKEVPWEEALSYVAAMINKVILSSGPEAVGGLISPRCTNEEAYLFQKFMREVVGTDNIDTTGRFCLEPYRLAIREVMGKDYLPYSLDGVAEGDCIIIAGGDLDRDNLIAANLVREALWRRGARLIVVHPRRIRLAEEADCWFCLRPGDELVWVNGLIHLLLEKGKGAWGPRVEGVKGLDALKEAAKKYTPEYVEGLIGVPQDLLREAAEYLAQAKKPAIICSPPLGQQPQGVDQIKGLANLALLCGALSEGGGFHFIGPQSNMLGVVEMGSAPSLHPGYRPVDGKGLSAMEMFQAASEGRLKALFILGENPLITLPKSLAEEGLKDLDILVVQDMFLSETAEEAHVVLPALSFAELDGTYTNCEGRVQRLRKALKPPDGLRWEGEVLSDLAAFMGKEMKAESPAGVFEEIKGTNPLYKGMDFEALDAQVRDDGGGDLLEEAAFCPVESKQEKEQEGYPFSLSVEGLFYNHLIGSGPQRRALGLAKLSSSPYLEMNAEEARGMGIGDGDRVKVTTPWGEVEVEAKGSEGMRRDVLSLYLSFYEVDASGLVGPQLDPVSKVPLYGRIPARVEKI